jgi:hypothetical protein
MIKFMWNGVKVNSKLYRAHYSFDNSLTLGDKMITIHAKDLCVGLPQLDWEIENNSDSMTDYCDADHVRLAPGSKYYNDALKAAIQAEEKYVARYIKKNQTVKSKHYEAILAGMLKQIEKMKAQLGEVANKMLNYQIGQVLYYTGDVANQPGWFEIVSLNPSSKYSPESYNLMEIEGVTNHGRTFEEIWDTNIIDDMKKKVGHQFVTREAYEAFWSEQYQMELVFRSNIPGNTNGYWYNRKTNSYHEGELGDLKAEINFKQIVYIALLNHQEEALKKHLIQSPMY